MTFENSIALYAELALALAGFAGIVSAFAGRERQFRPVERLRLGGLMSLSGMVLAGCLAYIVGSLAGIAEATVLVITATVCLIPLSALVLFRLPQLWRRSEDADATVAKWSLYLVAALMLADLLLFGAAIFVPGSAWMIALGFSLMLLHALWMFVLLLTRAN
ncbi:MAG: hypothetical protein ACI9JM_000516 [Halioglobus sp.]|jgi:hypothetical protein